MAHKTPAQKIQAMLDRSSQLLQDIEIEAQMTNETKLADYLDNYSDEEMVELTSGTEWATWAKDPGFIAAIRFVAATLRAHNFDY